MWSGRGTRFSHQWGPQKHVLFERVDEEWKSGRLPESSLMSSQFTLLTLYCWCSPWNSDSFSRMCVVACLLAWAGQYMIILINPFYFKQWNAIKLARRLSGSAARTAPLFQIWAELGCPEVERVSGGVEEGQKDKAESDWTEASVPL